MKHYLLLILTLLTAYARDLSSLQFEKRVTHLINSALTTGNKNVRAITDPAFVFSADGTGIMDNLSTTTSIVNSGTLSVTGTSTLGAINGSSLSLSNNATITGTLSVTGITTPGTVNASSLSLSGNETVTGTVSVTGIATLGTVNASTLSLSGNETITGNLTVNGAFTPNNLDLVDSTATLGNITKVGTRFITNFGTNNTFAGKGTGNFTLTPANAIQNTALGALALSGLTTGASNTAIGYNAAPGMTTGSNNSAFGQGALPAATTGSSNIAIGSGAGGTLTTGSSNIYIGANASSISESGTIRIGTSGTHLNTTIAGNIFLPDVPSGLGLTIAMSGTQLVKILSSRKFKKNIQPLTDTHTHKLLQLQPVSFNFITDPYNTTQYGLIAEDVNDIMPELIVLDDNKQPYSVAYQNLYALLLKAIQTQQIILENQSHTIALLDEEISILKTKDNLKKSEPLIDSLQSTLNELLIRIIALESTH